MRTKLLSFFLLCSIAMMVTAKNTKVTVEQVTGAITLSEDYDYIITSEDPFAITGSINITNTEHAVVILQNIRPSTALSYLTFITINGKTAKNDDNCQVKKYAQGTIIMPYDEDFKPLTVYSEQNFQGDSVNDFSTGSTGGYMNTISGDKLNNQIRSFKLKRGYMVTFANGKSGYGYQRCFIADDEDLEMSTLPTSMDSRISSYRLFVWYDAEKKGIANTTDSETISALNASWCYAFSVGSDCGIDCECVPHKIYGSWPSTSSCGKVDYSCHMKTSNEPGNSSDDSPETVEEVLDYWQDVMRTGMRLCSPSSHDGSLSWLWEFMDSIDARGWRCDLLDMHCYWATSTFSTLATYYSNYQRPIWISEFLWGASWNSNGIFAAASDGTSSYSETNQQANYDGMQPILVKLNNWDYIERYAYWNSEAACSRIYYNGELSILGEYYAEMESGIGYDEDIQFVPTIVYHYPSDFAVEYDEDKLIRTITWTNENQEFTDSTLLEYRIDDGDWQTLKFYECSETEDYTYTDTLGDDYESGVYYFRVHNYDIDGKERMTKELQISIVAAEGIEGFQYGTLEILDTEDKTTGFDALADGSDPAVFTGLISYNDNSVVPVNTIQKIESSDFIYHAIPWNVGDDFSTEINEVETTDFMVLSFGQHIYDDITMEVGETEKIDNDTTWISFENPFEEGDTPVVIVNIITRYTAYPLMAKVWGITNEGFYVKLVRQAGVTTSTFSRQPIYYVAASKGSATLENGKILTVGRSTGDDMVDGRRARVIPFVDSDGIEQALYNPIILAGPQTNNLDVASVYRLQITSTSNDYEENYNGDEATVSMRVIRQRDTTDDNFTNSDDNITVSGDYLGWIIVSDPFEDPSTTGVTSVKQDTPTVYVQNGRIIVEGIDNYSIYSIGGQEVPSNYRLARGIYIVKAGNTAVKVLVP